MLRSRKVYDRIEGDDGVERAGGEVHRRHVAEKEPRLRRILARALNLADRRIDAGHVKAQARQLARDRDAGAATQVENRRAGGEMRDNLGQLGRPNRRLAEIGRDRRRRSAS